LLDKIPGGSFKKVSYLEVIYSFAEEKNAGKDKRDTSINGTFVSRLYMEACSDPGQSHKKMAA
jgi:hypothetical protein